MTRLNATSFYIELGKLEGWSVRQMKERIDSTLYERTALSRKPEEAIRHYLEQLRQDQQVSPDLLLKDPYILDFLDLNDRYLEKDLEDAILRDIEKFLLEMGAGFTFVARQKRLQIDDDDFYIDLLFYNRKLKQHHAVGELGSIPNISAVFVEFQQHLYSQDNLA
jgi:predicted nuclease of restriction endonuclease-like (RecB) superfamily